MNSRYPKESRSNPNFGSLIEYGIVMEAYSKDHTVKVRMTNGQIIARCKVIPKEWVAPNPDGRRKWSGRRSLPPANSRVIVLKPYYSYDGAMVIGSDFVYNRNYTTDNFASSGESDKAGEDYHITPGGWEITENRADGKISVQRGSASVTFRADEDGSLVIDIAADGGCITNFSKNVTIESAEKTTVKGADVEVNGKVKITGGSLECNGTASPTGTGCWCALPFCAFTGAPQTGNKAEGT